MLRSGLQSQGSGSVEEEEEEILCKVKIVVKKFFYSTF
jgi:hypothetical protein